MVKTNFDPENDYLSAATSHFLSHRTFWICTVAVDALNYTPRQKVKCEQSITFQELSEAQWAQFKSEGWASRRPC